MGRKKPPEREPPPWMADGKRFVAGLQTAHDPCCHKDFFDSDKLSEAKMMANNSAQRERRKALVFDRQNQEVVFRCDFTVQAAPKELPEEPTKIGRVKRK